MFPQTSSAGALRQHFLTLDLSDFDVEDLILLKKHHSEDEWEALWLYLWLYEWKNKPNYRFMNWFSSISRPNLSFGRPLQ